MLVLQILVSQLYVCVLPCRSFLFGVSWYANTINRSKYQPGCLMGTSHLLRLCISLLPARHSWSSCPILYSCILRATNSHIWQKMQNIQIIYFKMLQLNGHLHDQDKSGVALKVPTNPWPNPSSFLPSVLSIQTTQGLPVSEKPQTARILLLHREELPADVIREKELQRNRRRKHFSCSPVLIRKPTFTEKLEASEVLTYESWAN